MAKWLPRAALTVAALVTVLGTGPDALAGDDGAMSRWRLDYTTSEASCPEPSRMRALVVARLGFDPFAEGRPAARPGTEAVLRVVVERAAAGEGLDARVTRLEGETTVGERTLHHAGDCTELVASAALAGSILVDPTGELAKRQEPRTAPAPVLRREDPWKPLAAESKAPAVAIAPPASALEIEVGARFVTSVGVAPSPSFGVSLDGAVRKGRFVLRAEARADFGGPATRLPDGAGVATTLNQASLLPCVALDPFVLCGVVSMGAMSAESEDLVPKERDTTFYGAAGLRPMLDLRVSGQLHFVAGLEGVLALRRIDVSVRKVPVWSSPPVSAAASLGFALKFL